MRCYDSLPTWRLAIIAVLMVFDCLAQEAGFVDLTKVTPRLDLRRPALSHGMSGANSEINQILDCSNPANNRASLRTDLLTLQPPQVAIGDRPVFEVIVENVDSNPMRIPFSPHLADLQPKDPGKKFAYFEMQVGVWVAGGQEWSANTGGVISLYGNENHPATMLTLNPGESIRIVGKGRVTLPDYIPTALSHAIDHAYARVYLNKVETLLTATATATVTKPVCLSDVPGGYIPMSVSGLGMAF